MKHIKLYYLMIFAPVAIIFALLVSGISSSFGFGVALIIYFTIYRSLVDGIRLIELHEIDKKDFWKLFIPFWRYKYWKSLYQL